MKFFAQENIHKLGWALILVLAGIFVNALLSSYTTREESIKAGSEALKQNIEFHPKAKSELDSLKACFIKEQQDERLDKAVRHVNDSVILSTLLEVKNDVKEIKRSK